MLAGVRMMEAEGHDSLVTSYESVTDNARLDVVSAADTLRILAVHGAPARSDTGDAARPDEGPEQ